jgi:hypothetical protein
MFLLGRQLPPRLPWSTDQGPDYRPRQAKSYPAVDSAYRTHQVSSDSDPASVRGR